jgi:RIO kinase 2
VPVAIIASIANLRHGGTHKIISSLHRDNLLAHDQSCGYDGYRVTNSGYDILALWNFKQRGLVSALGDQIGVGKESDVYLAANPEGKQLVLKFHRLGRTSFRDVKKKRDYFQINSMKSGKTGKHGTISTKDQPNSWLFLSKISAMKEYTFMKALNNVGYPTPTPIAQNRHLVAMGLIRGVPLYQIHRNRVTPDQAESIFEQAMDICQQLVRNGLVHCDLNEFNLLVDLSGGAQNSGKDEEEEDAGDFYVRHSGSSATVVNKGDLTVPYGTKTSHQMMDGTGEIITEEPTKSKQMLENGVDARPIVTLIDFPQMVSVRHPNAEELWNRDIECLKRFFVKKLRMNLNEEDWEQIIPSWEDLIENVDEEDIQIDTDNIDGEGDDNLTLGGESKSVLSISSNSCLANRKQLRLDKELQASGFSTKDSMRANELHYYETKPNIEPVQEEEETGPEHGDNEEGDEDEGTKDKKNNEDEDDYDGAISDKEDDDSVGEIQVYREKMRNDDEQSLSNFSTVSRAQSYAEAEIKAREKVRRHLNERKKLKMRKGAYRSKNNNKSFDKGKRGFQDFTM